MKLISAPVLERELHTFPSDSVGWINERMTPVGDFSSITDFSFFENNGTAGI